VHRADDGRLAEGDGRLESHAKTARMEILACLEKAHRLKQRLGRHGEADARIVPLDAGDFIVRHGGHGHEQSEHFSMEIDQGATVVVGGDSRIGLQCLAPDSIQSTHDSHGHIWAFRIERSPHSDRPLAHSNLLWLGESRDGKRRLGVDLQQGNLAIVIGRYQFCRVSLPAGKSYKNPRRRMSEVDRTGNDVALGIDHESGRRPGAHRKTFDLVAAAHGLDLHDTGGNLRHGLAQGLLWDRIKIVCRGGDRNQHARHRSQLDSTVHGRGSLPSAESSISSNC
jgi:hypothetical protein